MRIERFPQNPIIYPNMDSRMGSNINGPSLIRVPEWLETRLGRYYLYFAHHQGTYIRLAYADRLEGPWATHEPGTLQLEETPCQGHIASPDVHVDDENERLIMYYHGSVDPQKATVSPKLTEQFPILGGQRSFVATSEDFDMELLKDLSKGLDPLSWTNAPSRWEPLPGGGIRVFAPAETDYFQNPNGHGGSDSAPYLWLPFEGDFVAQTHVQPTFASIYDAGALMVRHDETHWAKLCFESTDLGTHAAVSVVTNGLSDDANGADLAPEDIWLQIVRQGDLFGLHYCPDGEPRRRQAWRMVRYFALPLPAQVKVGLVAQSPVGSGTRVDFYSFTIESRRVENVRAGV